MGFEIQVVSIFCFAIFFFIKLFTKQAMSWHCPISTPGCSFMLSLLHSTESLSVQQHRGSKLGRGEPGFYFRCYKMKEENVPTVQFYQENGTSVRSSLKDKEALKGD